ncbi:MAG: hypothetical protein KAH48_11645 [Chlorobi bacterium]|nr:hypothetical protein [Chlorobiota bacterium]
MPGLLSYTSLAYNTYEAGSSLDIAYKTDETRQWRKNYNIHDHVRAIIRLRDTAEYLRNTIMPRLGKFFGISVPLN